MLKLLGSLPTLVMSSSAEVTRVIPLQSRSNDEIPSLSDHRQSLGTCAFKSIQPIQKMLTCKSDHRNVHYMAEMGHWQSCGCVFIRSSILSLPQGRKGRQQLGWLWWRQERDPHILTQAALPCTNLYQPPIMPQYRAEILRLLLHHSTYLLLSLSNYVLKYLPWCGKYDRSFKASYLIIWGYWGTIGPLNIKVLFHVRTKSKWERLEREIFFF